MTNLNRNNNLGGKIPGDTLCSLKNGAADSSLEKNSMKNHNDKPAQYHPYEKQEGSRNLQAVRVHVSGEDEREEQQETQAVLRAASKEIVVLKEELLYVNQALADSHEELYAVIQELSSTIDELRKKNLALSESQKELKRVNEQLVQFAFISSHDLQEPLRKIQVFSSLLSSPEANLNDFAKDYSGKINASTFRMSLLIRDLNRISILIENPKNDINQVNLSEIVDQVIEDFKMTIERKEAIIDRASLPVIHADPVKMNQLFHNLISNALKFSSENPVISISSRNVLPEDFLQYPGLASNMPYVCITVQDNGIGFDQAHEDKIFQPFQQLATKKSTEGTGVGLTICKKIVEDHGGVIFGKGKRDHGATITIFLPVLNV